MKLESRIRIIAVGLQLTLLGGFAVAFYGEIGFGLALVGTLVTLGGVV
ncbi:MULTISPECIES: hypothetical protein [Halorussus]|nr:hypothetical protein [Halorussus vallis]USZ76091.1 hypothetical protein NGM07_01910 [Halorussus vallis]